MTLRSKVRDTIRRAGVPTVRAGSSAPAVIHEALALEQIGRVRSAGGLLRRALATTPDQRLLLIAQAQFLGRVERWPDAAATWLRLIELHGSDIAPARWSAAVVAHRHAGDLVAATDLLARGLELHPLYPRLLRHRAELAMVRGDYEEAITAWADFFKRHALDGREGVNFPRQPAAGDWTAAAWHQLALHMLAHGIPDSASSRAGFLLAIARVLAASHHRQDALDLLVRWQEEHPPVEGTDLNDAERVRRMVARLTSEKDDYLDVSRAPIAVILERARHLEIQLHPRTAQELITEALFSRPHQRGLQLAHARLLTRAGDWPRAAEQWRGLTEFHGEHLSPHQWAVAACAQRRVPDLDQAEALLGDAEKLYPGHAGLLQQRAEVAMARRDWSAAALRWADFHDARAGTGGVQVSLPSKPTANDWFEAAWHHLAHHVIDNGVSHPSRNTPGFYIALARVLAECHLREDAVALLRAWQQDPICATSAHPDEVGEVERLIVRLSLDDSDHESRVRTDRDVAILDRLPDLPTPGPGLPPFRLLEVPVDSDIETAVHSAPVFNQRNLPHHVRLTERQAGWPGADPTQDTLAAEARKYADRYGEKWAVEPHLPASTLSDAMYLTIYHELSNVLPMSRLAARIADETKGPVFIQIHGRSLGYLHFAQPTEFALIHLYFALIRRGVNTFLYAPQIGRSHGSEPWTLTFHSAWWATVKHTVLKPETPLESSMAIVPAGIRAVRDLVRSLPAESTVYESGTVVGEYAYDRHHPRTKVVTATADLHPTPVEVPTFSFPLEPSVRLVGQRIEPNSEGSTVEAVLHEGTPLGGTWLDWLHKATGPFIEHLAARAHADASVIRYSEAHVCDYLLPEGAVVGDAVRRFGGQVILHPHSSNPVHLEVRRPNSFDVVRAVTATGAAQWSERFPDKTIQHIPTAMINGGTPREFSPGGPLSLVLFGGVATIGRTPWIDLDQLEQSYLALFEGLNELHEEGLVNVYFKPRGVSDDSEEWLFRIVGTRAGWQPIYKHGTRLDLPNQVFASVAVGTSALLEGIAVGTPGLIVRDFPVRDYTTLEADAFTVLDTPRVLKVLRAISAEEEYRELVAEQTRYAREELSFS